jgi:hypothetical protein
MAYPCRRKCCNPYHLEMVSHKANQVRRAQKQNEKAQATADAEKVVERAKGEKAAAIAVAEGQAEAIALIGKAMAANPLYLELKKVETWKGDVPYHRRILHTLLALDFADIEMRCLDDLVVHGRVFNRVIFDELDGIRSENIPIRDVYNWKLEPADSLERRKEPKAREAGGESYEQ